MLKTEDFSTTQFMKCFSEIEDPRLNRHKLYPLEEIFLTTLCAKIGGAESWEDIEDFGQAKLYFLKNYFPYKNGIPSHDTFARVFSLIDPKQFRCAFIEWMETFKQLDKQLVSIDGKTLKGSLDKITGRKPIHMVSAFASNARLVLGQEKVKEKTNEITAIPSLLDAISLKGATVTIDAMGCQKQIAKKITQKKGHYVLGLKGNHKGLNEDVRLFFEKGDSKEFEFDETVDKGHGRIEIRKCYVTKNIKWLENSQDWEGLKSLVKIESTRIVGDKETVEKRYYLSSLDTGAQEHQTAVRSHWAIENSLHWILDVTFNEDKSRIRKGNAPENMAIVRHIVMNLVRQVDDPKTSLKRRRRRALYSDQYLANILEKKF